MHKGQKLSLAKRLDHFLQKVQLTDHCWEWQGTRNKAGYGIYRWGVTRLWLAHRLMWHLFIGSMLDPKILLCHHCDNPRCVRPSHLFPGTHLDNVRDKLAKGRQTRGEEHSRTKLQSVNIPVIRQLYKEGHRQEAIAIRFGVKRGTISCIVNRTTWKHIQ